METRPPAVFQTFLLIFVAMAVLFAADAFLAHKDEAARGAEARRLFREGRQLESKGDLAEAIDRFRGAYANARQERGYQLALAQALLEAGRMPEAEETLTELLAADSTGGGANLTMARLLSREGKTAEAISYYHRAIYGQWPEDAAANRVRTRFELVDLLASRDRKSEMLAELLPLEEEAPQDAAARLRIGRLFVEAGAPRRAADIFRALLRRRPQDGEAYGGLGEAEFELGNYRIALGELAEAARLLPQDARIGAQLDLCRRVLELDPMRRGISTRERLARSRTLAGLALEEARACAGAAPPEPLAKLMETARRPSADTEANLDLAERLWQARRGACGASAAPADQALALVMARLAQ